MRGMSVTISRRTATRSAVTGTAAAFLLSFASADVASAATTKVCSVKGVERTLGPGTKKSPRLNHYTTRLTYSGNTSCRSARSLVRSYYSCRHAAGGATGRCTKRINNFRCTERRGKTVRSQFDATVTCKKSGATITHRYTQFTR